MPFLKSCLATLLAVLAAGLLFFSWHRAILIWESRADAMAAEIRSTAQKTKEARMVLYSDEREAGLFNAYSAVLERRANEGHGLLKAFAPLRDERTLKAAIDLAEDEIREDIPMRAKYPDKPAAIR